MPLTQGTLLFLDHSVFLHLRGYHSLWHSFPGDFDSKNGCSPPHLPPGYPDGIRLDLSGLHSPLLTGSHCFLFHPLLRCFISGGCCTFLCAPGSTDRRLRASPRGLSQLAARVCGHKPSHPLTGVATYDKNFLLSPYYISIKFYKFFIKSIGNEYSCFHLL